MNADGSSTKVYGDGIGVTLDSGSIGTGKDPWRVKELLELVFLGRPKPGIRPSGDDPVIFLTSPRREGEGLSREVATSSWLP
jgi:hypothetical protein